MADPKKTSTEETKKVDINNGITTTISVADLSVPSIIAALHEKAAANASKKAVDISITNSAIEGDGKTAKLTSAGEHIISVVSNKKDSDILKTDALAALKEYVTWFVGPDLAAKVTEKAIIPLGESKGQVQDNDETDEPDEGETSKDVDDDETSENKNESRKIKSFLSFLFEDNDEEGDTENAPDGEEDDGINPEDSGEEDTAEDADEKSDLESAVDGEEDKDVNSGKKKKKEESAPGYYLGYNLKVQGLKETALKDAIKKFGQKLLDSFGISFGPGLVGSSGSFDLSVGDIRKGIKKLLEVDKEKLKTNLGKYFQKKFPELDLQPSISINSKNELFKDPAIKSNLKSKDKKALDSVEYAVRIVATKGKYSLSTVDVADAVTSSISGLISKVKNKVKKEDVIYIQNYTGVASQEEKQKNSNSEKKIVEPSKIEEELNKKKAVSEIKDYIIKQKTQLEAEKNKTPKIASIISHLSSLLKNKYLTTVIEKEKNEKSEKGKQSILVNFRKSKLFTGFIEKYKEIYNTVSETSIRLLSKNEIRTILLETLFTEDDDSDEVDEESSEVSSGNSGSEQDKEKIIEKISESAKSSIQSLDQNATVLTDSIDVIKDKFSKTDYQNKEEVQALNSEQFNTAIAVDTDPESKLNESYYSSYTSLLHLLFEAETKISYQSILKTLKNILIENNITAGNIGDLIELTKVKKVKEENEDKITKEADAICNNLKKKIQELVNDKLHNSLETYCFTKTGMDTADWLKTTHNLGEQQDLEKISNSPRTLVFWYKMDSENGKGSRNNKNVTEEKVKAIFDNLLSKHNNYQFVKISGISKTAKYYQTKNQAEVLIFIGTFSVMTESQISAFTLPFNVIVSEKSEGDKDTETSEETEDSEENEATEQTDTTDEENNTEDIEKTDKVLFIVPMPGIKFDDEELEDKNDY